MRPIRSLLVLSWLIAVNCVAKAGDFAVSPVRIELDAETKPVVALTVRNRSDAATVIQVEIRQWRAAGDQDEYIESRDLVVTPPLFTLKPHGAQVMRVGLRQRNATTEERSFRLYLREVPQSPAPGFNGLNVALRLGVPVFVNAPDIRPQLDWQLTSETPGAVTLTARNSGSAHARLRKLNLLNAEGKLLGGMELARDILPGQHRQWSLPLDPMPAAGASLRLNVQQGREEQVFDLVMPQN